MASSELHFLESIENDFLHENFTQIQSNIRSSMCKYFSTASNRDIEIHVAWTEYHTEIVTKRIKREIAQYRVIGVDTEWVYSGKDRKFELALLQISTSGGFCALIRLCRIRYIPDSVKNLLEDCSVIKVGQAILNDAKILYEEHQVVLTSCLPLEEAASYFNKGSSGLKYYTKITLGITLDKEKSITCSNWKAMTLTERQRRYGAWDAFAPIKILETWLESKYTYLELTRAKFDEEQRYRFVLKYMSHLLDVYYAKIHKRIISEVVTCKYHSDLPDRKLNFPICNKNHDYRLQTMSGRTYRCGKMEAEWFLNRKLACLVQCDLPTVKLNFVPNKDSILEEHAMFYKMNKYSHCVGCSLSDTKLYLKFVIPTRYVKYIPPEKRRASQYFRVNLCRRCFSDSTRHDMKVSDYLITLCDAPDLDLKYISNERVIELRSYSRSIKKNRTFLGGQLTEAKRCHMIKAICTFLDVGIPSNDLELRRVLSKMYKVPARELNPHYKNHAELVIKHFVERNELHKFEELWQNNFVSSLYHIPTDILDIL